MTTDEARKTVTASVATVLVLTTLDHAADGDWPGVRPVIGAAVMALGLSAMAGPAPELAAGLALLAAVSSVVSKDKLIGKLADNLTGKAPRA